MIIRYGKLYKKYKSSLLSHTSDYFVAELLLRGTAFVGIPIFTRLLSPEEYGVLSIYNTFVQILTIIILLNIPSAIYRFYFDDDDNYSKLIGSNLIFLTGFCIIMLLIVISNRNTLTTFLNVDSKLIISAIVASALSGPFEIYLAYLQAIKNSRRYAIIATLKAISILGLSVAIVLILKDDKYFGKIYAQIIITIFFLVYSLIKIKKVSEFHFRIAFVKKTLLYSFPLIISSLSNVILTSFDRVMINQMVGNLETGYYSFAYNIGMIMQIAILSINRSWTPSFYKKLDIGDIKGISQNIQFFTKIIYLASILLLLFSSEVITIMASSQYMIALDIIPFVILGYVFQYFGLQYAQYFHYSKRTIIISIATIIAGVSNVILNYIFIPKYGYIAAAYTTVISYVILFMLIYLAAIKYIGNNKLFSPIIFLRKSWVLGLVFILVYISNKLDFNNLIIIKLIISILCIVILFRRSLKKSER